jgi:nitroimidazol reductase NimA-like FMN-containing flavoprotein (pyridoxamine 5'-phosphate oxidase superfamily)
VRRQEKEILDRAQIGTILDRALVCRIALCDDSTPYVLPVNFGYESGCLYIHCALEGKKLDILKRNSMVCFEVDIDHALVVGPTPCSYTFNYRSVIGFGSAIFVDNVAEKRKGLDAIIKHYSGGHSSYYDDALAKITILKIEIESMTGKQSGY